MKVFTSADILLPDRPYLDKWAVVACDQYSSEPAYWKRVEKRVKDLPSTFHLILPEAWLKTPKAAEQQKKIRSTMEQYLNDQLFKEYPDSYVYVERTLTNGLVRQGLVGQLDLEAYDYHCPSTSPIRATEATILERIPARAEIRKDAILEFPHILLLQNDPKDELFQALDQKKQDFPVLYDLDLMENGGHITGYWVSGENKTKVDELLAGYELRCLLKQGENPLLYAVGDGNHSLAAARSIWDRLKVTLDEKTRETHPARFALAELENLQHPAQKFEPIHRFIKDIDVNDLLASIPQVEKGQGYAINYISAQGNGTVYLDPSISVLPLAVLQKYLDEYLADHKGVIDYIHGELELALLCADPDSIGFFLPAIDKDSLFETIEQDGSLPRKTFSMGHAQEKRFYMEGKTLQPK